MKHGPRSLSCARANGIGGEPGAGGGSRPHPCFRFPHRTHTREHQRRKKHNLNSVRDYGRDSLLVPPSPGVIPGMPGLSASPCPRVAVCVHACAVTGAGRRLGAITYRECAGCDPKDGELCLIRLKSGETLMEDRSSSDVQIDCQNWA